MNAYDNSNDSCVAEIYEHEEQASALFNSAGTLRQSSGTILYQELLASLRELDDEVEELVINEGHLLSKEQVQIANDDALDQLLSQAAEVITTPEASDPSSDTAEVATTSMTHTHLSPISHPQDATPSTAAAATHAVCLPSVEATGLFSGETAEWRCIDSTHEAGCTCCREPPPVEDERKWVLLGDQNWKNGEKKLRSLLQKTNEWRSPDAREQLAAKIEEIIPSQTDDGSDYYYPKMQWQALVTALRNRDLTALRKTHLLLMCREWKFKSDVWSPRSKRNTSIALALQYPCGESSGSITSIRSRKRSGEAASVVHVYGSEKEPVSSSAKDNSNDDHVVVRDMGTAFMSSGIGCMGHDIEPTAEKDYLVLQEKRRELFEFILPKVKEGIEVVITQPHVVNCMVGHDLVDTKSAETAFFMEAAQNGLKCVVEECITTGENSSLSDVDPVVDADSLRRCYNLVRLSLLEAINTERVRLLLATCKQDLIPDDATAGKVAQFDRHGYVIARTTCAAFDIEQVCAGTFGLIKAQCALYTYIMAKVPEHVPPEVIPYIRQHALINRSCVHHLEGALADTLQKTSNFEVVRQLCVNVLDMLALTQCSKDQILHRKRRQRIHS